MNLERFIKYLKIETSSNELSLTHPSSKGQVELAMMIKKEFENMGVLETYYDGILYVKLPSNSNSTKTLGLVAHLDIYSGFNSINIKPVIIKNFNGEVINLRNDVTLNKEIFSELYDYIGDDLISSDGTSILGASGKAGICEIVDAMEIILKNPSIKIPNIVIAFVPDQEIDKKGINHIDLERFSADLAIIMDGDGVGTISFESFNGSHCEITIQGRQVFTGEAKDKMINAISISNEFISSIPFEYRTENTSGYEGFIHIESITGTVSEIKISAFIRDFDEIDLNNKKNLLINISEKINNQFNKEIVHLKIDDDFKNMSASIIEKPKLINGLINGIALSGILPKVIPVRGSCDGSFLSANGIPSCNHFTGVHNCHGPYEFITKQSMDKAINSLISIIEYFSVYENWNN
jgi:tripeptide aminopeptidase